MWWSEDASGPGQLAVNNGSKAAFYQKMLDQML